MMYMYIHLCMIGTVHVLCICCTHFVFVVVSCFLQNEFAWTALSVACDKGHTIIADILVRNGANVNYRDKVRQFIVTVYH